MAGNFRKRRRAQGPNKNEQKVRRGLEADNPARVFGSLGSRFPTLKRVKVQLKFLDFQQRPFDEKMMTLDPSDAALFTVPCPGRCGQGTFDFGKKIAETIGSRLPFSESVAKCIEPLYAGSTETCGCEVKCRMDVEYFPAPAPAPASAPAPATPPPAV